jgi:hypothetical protein
MRHASAKLGGSQQPKKTLGGRNVLIVGRRLYSSKVKELVANTVAPYGIS